MKKFLRIFFLLALMLMMLPTAALADEDEDILGAAPGGEDDTEEETELPMPFTFEAPRYVFLDKTSEMSTVHTVNVGFSINDTMREYLALNTAEARNKLATVGLATLKLTAQIDWAIDDPTAWHYSEVWDNDGKDKKGQVVVGDWARIGIEVEGDRKKVQSVRIFPDFGDPKAKDNTLWKGTAQAKGYKDVIPADMLKTDENGHYYIDWTEHTLYVRVRYQCVTEDNDEEFMKRTYFSDWSETASFGKDVEEYYPYENEEALPIPELSMLSVDTVDPEVGPVLHVTTKLPEEFLENAIRTEIYGGVAHLIYRVRLNQDGEWIPIYEDVAAGEYSKPISAILSEGESYAEGDAVEINAFVWIDQYLGLEGEWVGSLSGVTSETITYGIEEVDPSVTPTPEITVTPEPTPTPTLPPMNIPTPVINPNEEEEKDVCPICHMDKDPQFFGVCMFIWGGGIILLIIIISIIVRIVRRKQDEKTDILFR